MEIRIGQGQLRPRPWGHQWDTSPELRSIYYKHTLLGTYCSLGLNISIRKQRKELTLDEKAKLLKDFNDGAKEKVLTEKYGVSRKQVYNIVQNKRMIIFNIKFSV